MRAVGIRELKNKLSHYIRLVEAGESILDQADVVGE
ncbi:MAG: prevent-host-death protein, partial [Gemmatimonadetes bacterium]|nr:prevent-host-death protein [Gemmatimonadota bacterium]NIR77383.1 prevent-host-death protein [Gemmatimonadota bacterium]NIT85893.1 prevent-host-death protein [Gemmatimonadota bacterium]NIU29719.1 prevent-host-death protein [Gemmatimonadota bacterium]NIU34761.1 prevent-host-death protein [Gemmatimonadota bacterium]